LALGVIVKVYIDVAANALLFMERVQVMIVGTIVMETDFVSMRVFDASKSDIETV
jgi:hypothetical protein